MNKQLPLIVAGSIFVLVGLVHALRLYYQWNIQVDGQVIPMSISIIGLPIILILAIWMFLAARKK